MILGSDNSVENIQQLVKEIKRFVELEIGYTKLQLTEKLTILISTMILVLVIIILGMVALFYLSFTLAYVLAPHVGGLMVSFGIITLFLVLLIICAVAFRQKLIFGPMVRFLSSLFLADDNEADHIEEEEKP